MKKQFCDVCEEEFKWPCEFETSTPNGKAISFQVHNVSVQTEENAPAIHRADVCGKCLAAAMVNAASGVAQPSWVVPF